MHRDANGLGMTCGEGAAEAFDHAVAGFLAFRADTAERVAGMLAEHPGFGLAHCLKGYLSLMNYAQAAVPVAAAEAAQARICLAAATPRELAHVAALEAWAADCPDRAVAIWEAILREHPRDILAFRLSHFLTFWLGRPDAMLASVLAIEPHWEEGMAAYGSILGCRCFALEECGRYVEAEAAGRTAIDLDGSDLWAAHGIAHVLEMQGRREEGIAWLQGLGGNWEGASNLRHHLWWHAALFHLERGETERVLDLYDAEFRNLAAPLTAGQPDLYIDMQNAASMLFRLERLGVSVGNRWEELADKAEARIGDCRSGFTLPHWMMALAASGRHAAAERMLEAMRAYARGPGLTAARVGRYALPISEAVLAYGRGAHARAVALMRPALGGMSRLGGSHAQQDVLEQLYLDAALKADLVDDVRLLLERVAGRHPVPPGRRVGYAAAARRIGFM